MKEKQQHELSVKTFENDESETAKVTDIAQKNITRYKKT